MILAETITCTATAEPPMFVELIPNWAASVACDLPSQSLGWEFWVQLTAALGTVGAVLASILLSYSAKKEASRLEFLRRELDRYEELHSQFIALPYWVRDEPESFMSRGRDIATALDKWRVYARTRNQKLADSWFRIANRLLVVARVLATANDSGIPSVPGYEEAQTNLIKWLLENKRSASWLRDDIELLLDEMANLYTGELPPRKLRKAATALNGELSIRYKIVIDYASERSAHNRQA